jgi:hypothetical protein
MGMAILLVPVLFAYVYFVTPSVYAEASARGVTIHCEVLHDYPSDVGRIDIQETATGMVVWSVKARGSKFQLHTFDLTRGWNADTLRPSFGQFDPDIPRRGPFYLRPRTGYQASICSPPPFSICRVASFTLQ